MSVKSKIVHELKAILLTSLYFLSWFGALMVVKILLLHEYEIEFKGASILIVATLVVTKVVLILENVKLTKCKSQAAIVGIILRTLLYLAGVILIFIIEHALEARHEYGGFINALKNLFNVADSFHILVNSLCVLGALLFFNAWSVVKKHLGEGSLKSILLSPVPDKKSE